MSELSRAVGILKGRAEAGVAWRIFSENGKKLCQELSNVGLLKWEITDDELQIFTVESLTKLGCKLIKLSQDEEKWEKVKNNDDTSVIDDDDLKKAVEHLLQLKIYP